jgi:hypothetical protein
MHLPNGRNNTRLFTASPPWVMDHTTENEWANDTDRFALAAHPGKSQGPPPKSTGSKPIVQNGVPDAFSTKNPLSPVNRYYAPEPRTPAP